MSTWKETLAGSLRILHLESIRSRILVFAVLATLIPALATALIAYRQNQLSLHDRIVREIRNTSSEAALELNRWLDERLKDLREATDSYVVPENLVKIGGRRGDSRALARLRDYLNSVRGRLADHEALMVLDARGRVVASTSGRTGRLQLPLDRLDDLRTGDALVGDAYWDTSLGKAVIMLAVPIREADGRFLGAFAAKINLQSIADILRRLAPREPGSLYLMTDDGQLVLTSGTSSAALMRTKLPNPTTRALFDQEGATVEYSRSSGQGVIGTLRRVPRLGWGAVTEMSEADASRQAGRPRIVAGLIFVLVLAAAGLVAGILALRIIRPLGRLTGAATSLAGGDLSVDFPVGEVGEVGYLAQVFRTLATRLREREGQGELERLSITDALTGLYNRRHLLGTLTNEVQRSRRLRRTFSLLMADVDHFKQYNDTHGHLAGDAALVRIAEILRKTTRGVDSVVRYGGEEFLVVLLEATNATAVEVAERIRARVAAEPFDAARLTVSIGVAEFPAHGDTLETLIASADAAMYQAKSAGRDRVVAAD